MTSERAVATRRDAYLDLFDADVASSDHSPSKVCDIRDGTWQLAASRYKAGTRRPS